MKVERRVAVRLRLALVGDGNPRRAPQSCPLTHSLNALPRRDATAQYSSIYADDNVLVRQMSRDIGFLREVGECQKLEVRQGVVI